MFNIVLVAPEIPPNTGNVIRLAANTGCRLHLVEPLGFAMADPLLRRAGLDYHEYVDVRRHASWPALHRDRRAPIRGRLFAFTTDGGRAFADVAFAAGDWLVFGAETAGPARRRCARRSTPRRRVRLPMRAGQRSLNLSNAVAVAVFEAWRQNGYAGGRSDDALARRLGSRLAPHQLLERIARARSGRRARRRRRRRSASRRRARRRARSTIGALRTPSATWPRSARMRASALPPASSTPTVRLRDRSPVAVSTRSPSPDRPMKVSASAPRATPSRVISARPRVTSAARALRPRPMPSAMPVAIASTFLTAPPTSTPTGSAEV